MPQTPPKPPSTPFATISPPAPPRRPPCFRSPLSLLFVLLLPLVLLPCSAMHPDAPPPPAFPPAPPAPQILLLDHMNLNHRLGDHQSVLSFYVRTLALSLDSRKAPNIDAGEGTLWVNAGATQLHLSGGRPEPQVLDGRVTFLYKSVPALSRLQSRAVRNEVSYTSYPPGLASPVAPSRSLGGGGGAQPCMVLRCPYGNEVVARVGEADPRGSQPDTDPSMECNGISEVELFVPDASSLPGIARFYNAAFAANCSVADGPGTALSPPGPRVRVAFGPTQHVTFRPGPQRNQGYADGDGPHVSLYVGGLAEVWGNVQAIDPGLVYVNPRFKRQALTLADAEEQCMFRVLNIVDPLSPGKVLFRLEHEIRSPTNKDGTKYKSYPLGHAPP
ncbi:hypothetical protein TeGR_g15040 [Tetraparma gracilis]|uniref:VOC domain-containing protein n=1 Tax=Tetraparma gracilis TaxID=2962635 RepID=A0ABQ6N030_9STRA|nr:hypothetical protein TeGR_g15040 [Tetraparma gracilis]